MDFQIFKLFYCFFLVLFGTKLPQILPVCILYEVKFWDSKSQPGWGLDDQVSSPALDETVECNTFVFFNLLMLIERKCKNEILNCEICN